MVRRSEPFEPPPDPVLIERVGSRSRRPALVVAVIATIIGIAIVKPWQNLPQPQLVSRALPTSSAQPPITISQPIPTPMPAPTIDPAIDAASGKMICNAPEGWRLISAETDVFGESRTMFGIDAARATGPSDATIPTAQLRANQLYGVGVCRPNPEARRVPDLPFNSVTIWLVEGGTATAVADPTLLSLPLYRLGEAYFGPPRERWSDTDNATPAPPSWRSGRYVVQIAGATPTGDSLWVALDFLTA